MDRYTRWFVLASLVYLAAGGILGLLIVASPTRFAVLRYAHVHLLLGGFMAMMVFGVGYFILPRFAGKTLRWPSLVAPHFWLGNLSLLLLSVAWPAAIETGSRGWMAAGHAASFVLAGTFVLFAVNMGATLTGSVPDAAAGAQAAPAQPVSSLAGRRPVSPPPGGDLGAFTPVAEVVERREGALEILVDAGLAVLRDPSHLEMVRARGVTLGTACERHGIPLDDVVRRLSALPERRGTRSVFTPKPDTVIGDLVALHPETRRVLELRFGEGCFTCPGFATETLAQGAMMHGVAVEDLLGDLERAIRSPGS